MRSFSRSNLRTALFLLLSVGIGACAGTAPHLPPDYGSTNAKPLPQKLSNFEPADVKLSCENIGSEKSDIRSKMNQLSAKIAGKHGGNQVVGYIGSAFFAPALLAADYSIQDKEELERFQLRLDKLALLQRLKDCPAPG